MQAKKKREFISIPSYILVDGEYREGLISTDIVASFSFAGQKITSILSSHHLQGSRIKILIKKKSDKIFSLWIPGDICEGPREIEGPWSKLNQAIIYDFFTRKRR